jgi:Protease inhibitor Inh
MRWVHGWRGLVLASGLLAGSSGQAATPPIRGQDLAGVWDLSNQSSNSKCRIALRAGPSASSHQQITIPFSCVKAFPDLAPVAAWELTGDGHLNLFDNAGQKVLDFTPTDSKAFNASRPQGGVYRLAVMQSSPQKKDLSLKGEGASPAPVTPVTTKKESPATAIPAADMAGRYSILRDGGKDTGCMLTLDSQAKGPGGKKASLAPGCRDQGIVIFDPVGWQILNGRLLLTARKGHKTDLDLQPDGSWKKDPKEGKSLILKKQ